jgi:hypothetical protein
MVAAALRQAFSRPGRTLASQTPRHERDKPRSKWPTLVPFIHDNETDVRSSLDIPEQQRSQLHSAKPR